MKVVVLTKEEINEVVSKRIIALINQNPKAILGLATGSSPIGVYEKLVEANKAGLVSFKQTRTWNLDEYEGLDETSDQSYRYFMNHHLFDHIDIDKANTHVPAGKGNLEKAAKEYDEAIAKAGGIDFQLLGIGSDGHIAFNEPGTPFDSLTHVAELAPSTIKDNSRFFASIDDVPTKAITMGLASIMAAKEIVLIALGPKKAPAIDRLLHGPMTEDLPCSILQKHPNVTIYLDEPAYSLAKRD